MCFTKKFQQFHFKTCTESSSICLAQYLIHFDNSRTQSLLEMQIVHIHRAEIPPCISVFGKAGLSCPAAHYLLCWGAYLTTLCLSLSSELLVPKLAENNEFVPGQSQESPASRWHPTQPPPTSSPLTSSSCRTGLGASSRVYLHPARYTWPYQWMGSKSPCSPGEVKHSHVTLRDPSAAQWLAPIQTPSITIPVAPVVPLGAPPVLLQLGGL